jgi:hypothetical protein
MTEWTPWHERHADKIELVAGIDCWIWTAATGGGGYGRVSYNKKAEFAHRASFIEANGDIPKGKVVRHNCGNRLCVRPSHLVPGTPADNARDTAEMFRAGRSKLSAENVREIRNRYNAGEPLTGIADALGIASGTVYPIVSHRALKYVDSELAGTHKLRCPRKLSAEMATEICAKALSGKVSQSQIAAEYGIAQGVVSRIKNGKLWPDALRRQRGYLPVVADMIAGELTE